LGYKKPTNPWRQSTRTASEEGLVLQTENDSLHFPIKLQELFRALHD
jgi:hypothetical protein